MTLGMQYQPWLLMFEIYILGKEPLSYLILSYFCQF